MYVSFFIKFRNSNPKINPNILSFYVTNITLVLNPNSKICFNN